MRSILLVVVLLFSAACSDTPTSPSPPPVEEPPPTPAPPPSGPTLRWDIVAAGCTPAGVPNPIPATGQGTFHPESGGQTRVSWAYTSSTGQTGVLSAFFVQTGSEYHLCSWDLSDL